MDFNGNCYIFGENYNIEDLQAATVMTADNVFSATVNHNDDVLPTENRVPSPDFDRFEYSLVQFRTENIWQDHQRLQFRQQVNTWNMMRYKMWKRQQQQHLIPMYLNAWSTRSAIAADAGIVKINLINLVISENKVSLAFKYSVLKILIISGIVVIDTIDGNIRSYTKKQKRTRIHYTNYQIFILESIFQNNRYLSRIMRERLANELGITEKQVKIWFQNRRTKKMSI
ncbi:hypothetical protein QTP88_019920 [Uroleucon formosanum]